MKIKRIWKMFTKHYGISRLIEAIWAIGPLIVTITTKAAYPTGLRIICCLIGGLLFIYGTYLDIKGDKKKNTNFKKTYAVPHDIAMLCGTTLLLTTLYL